MSGIAGMQPFRAMRAHAIIGIGMYERNPSGPQCLILQGLRSKAFDFSTSSSRTICPRAFHALSNATCILKAWPELRFLHHNPTEQRPGVHDFAKCRVYSNPSVTPETIQPWQAFALSTAFGRDRRPMARRGNTAEKYRPCQDR